MQYVCVRLTRYLDPEHMFPSCPVFLLTKVLIRSYPFTGTLSLWLSNYISQHPLRPPFPQADLGHGGAQAVGAAVPERAVVQEPGEDAGGTPGHPARVHRAEAQHRPAGEQADHRREE